ncbi:GNAT family N-acetyltransferase [Tropicibacter oceani]|uniref:GNAT family N-acetyltransferase n=1 Tax=Tropicibacter oceani TaxID=3058420 RepID=A0ABY8QHD7_9RHOB|nr:GNAT family N-acetyltransferase [Tropicibacter oceani]WGW03381.1 GNAT family N-acetyltransferase [Tropicibacter oceani]
MYRWANSGDYDALGQVMFQAIHAEPSPYTQAQRAVWALQPPVGPDWQNRLAAQRVALAETKTGPLGFASLRADGYVDLAFILPQARGRGHFRALLNMLIQEAEAQKMPALTTHASLAAQGPFAALGFTLMHHEDVQRGGETLTRALMQRQGAGQRAMMR